MNRRDPQQFRDPLHPGRVRSGRKAASRSGPDIGRSRERTIGGLAGNDLRGGDYPSSDPLEGQGSVAPRGEREDFLRPDTHDRALGTRPGYGDRGVGYQGLGPKNYQRSDARIEEEICERLSDDTRIDDSEIRVRAQDGFVTLEGSVDNRAVKYWVEDLAAECRGVKDIRNHLRVTTGTGLGQKLSTVVETVKDAVTRTTRSKS